MSARIPSTATVLATLVRVTLLRLSRGRALAVSVLIALLPLALAAALNGRSHTMEPVNVVQFLVLVLLPPMFVASSLGEEMEDRTTTYLWSRPIPRWSVVVGKLLALVPVSLVLVVGGFFLSYDVAMGHPPAAIAIAAMIGGVIGISTLSAGLATLVPKHGMSLSLAYLIIIDLPIGAIPASINHISITHQVQMLVDPTSGTIQPAITLAVIAAVWLAIAMWRIRRLES